VRRFDKTVVFTGRFAKPSYPIKRLNPSSFRVGTVCKTVLPKKATQFFFFSIPSSSAASARKRRNSSFLGSFLSIHPTARRCRQQDGKRSCAAGVLRVHFPPSFALPREAFTPSKRTLPLGAVTFRLRKRALKGFVTSPTHPRGCLSQVADVSSLPSSNILNRF